MKGIESSLTLKCIDLLVETVLNVLHADREREKDQFAQNLAMVLERKEQVVLTCMKLIDMITDYTILVEKRRGISFEQVQSKVAQNKQKKHKYKSYMAKSAAGADAKQEDDDDHESTEHAQML